MEENPVASSHPEIAARDSTPVLQPNISVVTKDHAGHEKSLTFLLCFTERFLLAAPPLVLSKKQRRRTTLKELIQSITGLTALYKRIQRNSLQGCNWDASKSEHSPHGDYLHTRSLSAV